MASGSEDAVTRPVRLFINGLPSSSLLRLITTRRAEEDAEIIEDHVERGINGGSTNLQTLRGVNIRRIRERQPAPPSPPPVSPPPPVGPPPAPPPPPGSLSTLGMDFVVAAEPFVFLGDAGSHMDEVFQAEPWVKVSEVDVILAPPPPPPPPAPPPPPPPMVTPETELVHAAEPLVFFGSPDGDMDTAHQAEPWVKGIV